MIKKIKNAVDKISSDIISNRRDFHKYPESAWTEFRTASLVARQLKDMGYKLTLGPDVVKPLDRMGLPSDEILESHYRRALDQGGDKDFMSYMKGGYTSLIADLDLGQGPTLAFRFDMDAVDCNESHDEKHLPLVEGFSSVNDHVMHACGHDCHTAMGLGFAKAIMDLKDDFSGKIKLIFQSAEEGVRGAKSIATKGIVDDVDYFYGMHIGTSASESGSFACGVDGFLATEKFDAVFKGKASHAGNAPNLGNNAILAACTAVTNLYAIPRHQEGVTRINVGRISGGTGRNVVPDRAQIDFEVRGATTEICDYVKDMALNIVESAAKMHNCDYDLYRMGGAESSSSDQELVDDIRRVAEALDIFHTIRDRDMMAGSEDVTYLMNRVKSCGGKTSYMALGTTLKAPHHNDLFDVNEEDMMRGVKLLLGIVYDKIGQE
ncbi:amidohydrolase [Acidaminobacter sp. JC074]|uniref:amidohydrolase n=1 Tax=Acidaminobacter sp. JC074 TaxID=2530199 RepID=UPI001F0CF2BD|nr:amidohydrolase [Acidaminobacter sp. JC074]MCH4891137.1 amidohydrolase [Acidaminobacter sp. JC074]